MKSNSFKLDRSLVEIKKVVYADKNIEFTADSELDNMSEVSERISFRNFAPSPVKLDF